MTGRKPTWTPEQDAALQDMKAKGYTHAAIAERFCVSPGSVQHRLKHLREFDSSNKPDPEPKTVAPVCGAHLEGYHRARRGFPVSKEQEPAYFDLLKSGTPIAVAARMLGLMKGEGA